MKPLNTMMKEMEEYYNKPTSGSEVNLKFTITSSSANPFLNLRRIFASLSGETTAIIAHGYMVKVKSFLIFLDKI